MLVGAPIVSMIYGIRADRAWGRCAIVNTAPLCRRPTLILLMIKSNPDEKRTAGIDRLIDALKHKPFDLTRTALLERRHADRLQILNCVRCDSPLGVTCVVRAPMAVYFLCASCGNHWSVMKPGIVFS